MRNCGALFEWHRDKAFCSLACKAVAEVVRYRRSAEERYPEGVPSDVMEAVRTKMSHTLCGGYDKQARFLSKERRAQVWAGMAGAASCAEHLAPRLTT